MNIAFAIHESLSSQGGVEVLAREMIKHFSKQNCIFLISKDSHEELKCLPEGCMLEGNFTYPIRETISNEWIKSLILWIKDNNVDLCHFHSGGTYGFHANSWFRCPITRVSQAGIRCIVTNHQALPNFYRLRSTRPLWRQLLAAIAKWPGKTKQLYFVKCEVNVSNHDLAISRDNFPFHKKKFLRIYHSRLNCNNEKNNLPETHVILNVATVCHRKGQEYLVEAFGLIAKEHAGWKLRLVGYDSNDGLSKHLAERIRELDLTKQIEFCGPCHDPVPFYRSAEIYVQPSLLEGLGLSLQEAMFYGLPCIGSRVGGIPELILDGKTGHLVDPGNILSLAQNLRRLINDRSERERLGNAAHHYIRERGMCRQSMLEQYEHLYAS